MGWVAANTRIHEVLVGMQNRTIGPYLAAINRTRSEQMGPFTANCQGSVLETGDMIRDQGQDSMIDAQPRSLQLHSSCIMGTLMHDECRSFLSDRMPWHPRKCSAELCWRLTLEGLPDRPFICLSVCLSVCPSICLSVCLSVLPYAQLSAVNGIGSME
jgi:hypothetical protein